MTASYPLRDYELTILSRLSMLAASKNRGKYFKKQMKPLRGLARRIAKHIRNLNFGNEICRGFLEWAFTEIGRPLPKLNKRI